MLFNVTTDVEFVPTLMPQRNHAAERNETHRVDIYDRANPADPNRRSVDSAQRRPVSQNALRRRGDTAAT
jgi:hypothetical protein